MVAKSGLVPCESHRRLPTIDLSSVERERRSWVDSLECGTESTGWPVRYGVLVGFAVESLLLVMSCSENAC